MNTHYLTLRDIQLAEFALLKKFDDFCKIHGLRYSLAYGTLLGAVRHKGFIPWDDDLDVTMPRPDYDKLQELASLLPSHTALQSAYNSNLVSPFMKLVDTRIMMQEPVYKGVENEYLWVDIFPLDGADADTEEIGRRLSAVNKMMAKCRRLDLNHSASDGLFKSLARKVCRLASGPGRYFDRIKDSIDEIVGMDDYESCDFVTPYFDGLSTPLVYRKQDVENTVLMEFEGSQFPVMSCWEYHLKSNYGDYMKIPDEKDRINHAAPAWYV